MVKCNLCSSLRQISMSQVTRVTWWRTACSKRLKMALSTEWLRHWVTEWHGGDTLSDKQMAHRSLGLGTLWPNNSNKEHGRPNHIILRVGFTTQLAVKRLYFLLLLVGLSKSMGTQGVHHLCNDTHVETRGSLRKWILSFYHVCTEYWTFPLEAQSWPKN